MPWGGAAAAPSSTAAPIADIQQQEAQQQQQKTIMKKPVAANAPVASGAGAGGELSSKLKSLVGVQPQQSGASSEHPVGWNAHAAASNAQSSAAQQQSLKEIMDEQERLLRANKAGAEGASATAARQHTWAGKLGAQASYSAPAPAPAPTAILTKAVKQATASVSQPAAPAAAAAPIVAPAPPVPSQPTTTNMTVELEEWCKLQMQKLGKPLELTLMSFCMEVESASEIREYFSDYFGSTPQVSLFASEFIKRKDAMLKNRNKNYGKK